MYAQLAQAGIQYEANSRDLRRQKELTNRQNDAQHEADQWAMNDEQWMQNRLRGLSSQRYASQRNLADALASPDRMAAGDTAGTAAEGRLRGALGRTAPLTTVDRSLTGSPGYAGWGANVAQNYQPAQDARIALMRQARSQQGMQRYDRNALNANTDTGIDIGRQAGEAQARSNYLSAARNRILAQAGIENRYNGPGNGYYNAQLASALIGAAGSAAEGYGGSSSSGGGHVNTGAGDRSVDSNLGGVHAY